MNKSISIFKFQVANLETDVVGTDKGGDHVLLGVLVGADGAPPQQLVCLHSLTGDVPELK